MQIAIDGPVGSGKSSVATLLAKELGFVHINTGNMYRAFGLFMETQGKDIGNEADVMASLAIFDLEIACRDGDQITIVNGKDITDELGSNEVGLLASQVSTYLPVRETMVKAQQEMALGKNVVLDGRDIGTVVLPQADFKFFIVADPATRAKRRQLQLEAKGELVDFDDLLKDVEQRDYQDMNRAHSPLKQAADAIVIDTNDLDLEAVLQLILSVISSA